MLKLLKPVSLLILILLINSCDDYCEVTDYGSYLPLRIGNKWTYHNNTTWEVIGTKEINDNEFYIILMEWYNYDGQYSRDSSYYRFEGSKLYQYNESSAYFMSDSLEYLLADFSLKGGDVFHQQNTDFNVTVLSDNPNEFTFYYDHPDWADEEYTITFGIDRGITRGWCIPYYPDKCSLLIIDYDLQ